MDRIRAVILGFAHMHVNEIAQYISAEKDFELVGLADVPPLFPEKTDARYTRAWNLRNNAEKYHLRPYEDYTRMLDELQPEMAFILCENASKPNVVLECAKRGIHVCIEKPMAVSYSEAQKIRDIAQQYGIEAIINWPVIWRPYIHRQLAALESGLVGKLVKSYSINGHTGPLGKGAKHRGVTETAQEMTDEERASTWWYQSRPGGGAFLDIGCYGCLFAALARPDGERALSVMAMKGNFNTPYMDAEDNAAVLIRYPDSFAVTETTWTTPQIALPTGPVYCCTDGVILCDPDRTVHAYDIYGKEICLPEYDIPEHIANIADHYAHCRRTGEQLFKAVTLEYNLRIMELLDAAVRSSDSGVQILL